MVQDQEGVNEGGLIPIFGEESSIFYFNLE